MNPKDNRLQFPGVKPEIGGIEVLNVVKGSEIDTLDFPSSLVPVRIVITPNVKDEAGIFLVSLELPQADLMDSVTILVKNSLGTVVGAVVSCIMHIYLTFFT